MDQAEMDYTINLIQSKNIKLAAKELIKLNSKYPDDNDIKYTCSLIYALMLDEFPDFQPTSSEEYLWSAIVRRSDENIFETLKGIATAIRLNPQNHLAFKWRANCWLKFGLIKEAKADLLNAISIYPKTEYYGQLGEVCSVEKDYESALFYHLQSLEYCNPNFDSIGTVHRNIGLSYANLGMDHLASYYFNK